MSLRRMCVVVSTFFLFGLVVVQVLQVGLLSQRPQDMIQETLDFYRNANISSRVIRATRQAAKTSNLRGADQIDETSLLADRMKARLSSTHGVRDRLPSTDGIKARFPSDRDRESMVRDGLYIQSHEKLKENIQWATEYENRSSKTVEQALEEYKRRYQREPPANFGKWVDYALANKCEIDNYDMIEPYFQVFRKNGGITKEMVRAAMRLESVGFYTINNSEIKDNGCSTHHFLVTILPEFVDILSGTPFTFVVNCLDEPRFLYPSDLNGNRLSEPFDLAKAPDINKLVYDNANSIGKEILRNCAKFADSATFDSKKPGFVWRGSSTGGDIRSHVIEWASHHRLRFQRLFGTSNNADVGITAIIQASNTKDVNKYYPIVDQISEEAQATHKFLMDIDGNSFSQRFMTFAKKYNSAIIKATIFDEFALYTLRPWIDYVPVDFSYLNVDATVDWLEKHPQVPKRIAQHANEMGQKRLRVEDMKCYWARVLPGFTSLAAGEDGCLGITPEGDVHRWVATASSGTITRGFAMEWSLSVLNDEANQRLQLRDAALGYSVASRSQRVAAVALMDSGDVFASQAWYADGGDGREGHLPLRCPDWRPVSGEPNTKS
eukprot:symbB.v1.2.022487.t1/scaffold1990.1/size93476/6